MNYYQNGKLITADNPLLFEQDELDPGYITYNFNDENGELYHIEAYDTSDFFEFGNKRGKFLDMCEGRAYFDLDGYKYVPSYQRRHYEEDAILSSVFDLFESGIVSAYNNYADSIIWKSLIASFEKAGIPLSYVEFPRINCEGTNRISSREEADTIFEGCYEKLLNEAQKWIEENTIPDEDV